MNLSNLKIENIESVIHGTNQPPWLTHIHKFDRPTWGVILVLGGHFRNVQGGVEYNVEPGMIQIVPRGGNYLADVEVGSAYYIVNFLAHGLDNRIHVFQVNDSSRYEDLMQRIYECSDKPHKLHQMAHLYEFFALLADEIENDRRETQKLDLSPAVRYMREHIDDPALDTEQLAAVLNISTVYFRKLFREQYGMPPIRWLTELRMRRAKHLLAEQHIPVAQVAQFCGYSDIFSFSNAFKKAVGMSPTAYVKDLL